MTYDKLYEEIYRPETRRAIGSIDRPLAFLNLCRGDFHPLSSQSMSELLIRNGNRGVISTSLKVPDEAAARFAGFFYDSLLYNPGKWAGAALLEAKRNFVRRFKNPLGSATPTPETQI